MNSNKVAIYARVSREDEAENNESKSIKNQIKALTDYANEYGFEIVGIYYDVGYSGEAIYKPSLNKMLEDAKDKKFNILLVKDISRLSRIFYYTSKLIEEILPSLNIRLISISDKYDSNTYKDEESIVIKNYLNSYYLKDFKKKLHNSIKHRSKTVNMKTYHKYGYLDNSNGLITIDLYAKEIIQRIFSDYILGKKPSVIVSELNHEGILPRAVYIDKINQKHKYIHSKEKWTASMITNIIKDYEYCGHKINLKYSKFYDKVILRNIYPQIIDENTFEKAQKIRINRNIKHDNNLHISKIINDSKSKNNPYFSTYESSNHIYYFKASGYSINANILHKVLYIDTLEVISSYINKETISDIYKSKIFKEKGLSKDKIIFNINMLNRKYQNIIERYSKKEISIEYFETATKKLNNEIKYYNDLLNINVEEVFNKLKEYIIKIKKYTDLNIIKMLIKNVSIFEYSKKKKTNKKYKILVTYNFDCNLP